MYSPFKLLKLQQPCVSFQAKLDHTVNVAKDMLMILLFMAAAPPETAYVDVFSLAAIYYLQRKPGP